MRSQIHMHWIPDEEDSSKEVFLSCPYLHLCLKTLSRIGGVPVQSYGPVSDDHKIVSVQAAERP